MKPRDFRINRLTKVCNAALAAVLLLLTIITFTACTDETFRENTSTEFYNVAYGEGNNQNMDIFLPNDSGEDVPFVLCIHGGGWAAGSKEDCYGICDMVNAEGYAAVTINYRLIGDGAKIPDMIADITSALQYLIAHSEEYNLLTDKTVLIGGSAGAHLALLYGYSVLDAPVDVVAVLSMSGLSDLTIPDLSGANGEMMYGLKEDATGDSYNYSGTAPASWIQASAINFVTANVPYTIIAHSPEDEVVPYADAVALDAALTGIGAPHDFLIFNNSGHGLQNNSVASDTMNALLIAALDEYMPLPVAEE
jgi:acetyl esterase/lipase